MGTPDVTALQEFLDTKHSTLAGEFKLVPMNYSLKQLTDAQDSLLNARQSYGVSAVGFDTKSNGLAVFVENTQARTAADFVAVTDIPLVILPISSLAISPPPNAFDNEESPDLSQIDESIPAPRLICRAGAFIGSSAGKNFSSLGALAVKNDSSSTVGFVTCGHGWSSNSNAYSGSTLIGTNAVVKNSGNTDASWFKKTSNFTWGGYRGGDRIDAVGTPKVNQIVYMLGANGTKSGYIEYVGVKGTVGGISFTDLFCYDFSPEAGDSGAAIIMTNAGDDILVGINKCTWNYDNDKTQDLIWGAGSSSFNIANSLNISFAN